MLDVHIYTHYVHTVIKNFRDKITAALFQGLTPKGVGPDMVRRTKMKLDLLEAAATLDFLRSPPGNRLEALRGDRAGQHSIRVNDQWRICFIWREGDAYDVEFCDYHQ
jgi:proteic killer suppression protein